MSCSSVPKNMLLALLVLLQLCACSGPPPPAPSTSAHRTGTGDSRTELPNMDQVESDSSLSLLSSRERRAAIIAGLWLQHGERLRAVSPAGSFAAFLRAAQFASDTMLSEACLDPFNERCAELRRTYVEAVRGVVAMLRANSWAAPDLSATRYRFSGSADGSPLSLSSITLAPESLTDTSGDLSRSGIGLATAGCHRVPRRRASPGQLDICAPLTFVISFDSPPESERIAATLTAHDAFQRDLVRLDGHDVTLAADFLAAWRLIRQTAAEADAPILACITPPSADEVTVVGLLDPTATSDSWVEMYAALSSKDDMRARLGFCVFPLRGKEPPDRLSRQLAGLLRQGALGNAAERLVTPRSELFLIADGERAARTATALLGQASRSERSRLSRALRKGSFSVRGIYAIPEAATPAESSTSAHAVLLQRAVADGIPVREPQAALSAESPAQSVAQLKQALGEAVPQSPPGEREPPDTSEPLQVSPVL